MHGELQLSGGGDGGGGKRGRGSAKGREWTEGRDAPCVRTEVKNGGENERLAGSDKGAGTKFSLLQST